MNKNSLPIYVAYLIVILLSLLFWVQPVQTAYAAGCTDAYDDNGNTVDNLTNHPILTTVPVQIARSLCGFYDADYSEFPAVVGSAYRIHLQNHENPAFYGVYLELWEVQADEKYRLLASKPAGVVILNSPAVATNRLILRVASLHSETGSYGGGDYTVSIVVQAASEATATPTVSTPTATIPTATLTPTATMRSKVTKSPILVPTASPIPHSTPTPGTPFKVCLPLINR